MMHTQFRFTGSREEWFLPYMYVAVIFAMCLRCREQTFTPPTHGGSTQNLALIGQLVLKMFENCGRTDDDGRTDAVVLVYYKLTW